jgi:two-component system cell cycle sensor histidine kinase/response regulator CckA
MNSQSILVVEDNPITRKMLRLSLESEGYGVKEAGDGRSALALVAVHAPDLLILDYVLPDMNGLRLLAEIRRLAGDPELPALLVTGVVHRLEELQAGSGMFTQFLTKPAEPSRLLEVVRAHLSVPVGEGRGRTLLVVDDGPLSVKLTALRLKRAGYVVETAESGKEGLEKARLRPPQAIVAKVLMPAMDGFIFCSQVRRDPRLAAVPVVLVSAAGVEDPDRELARKVGANAIVAGTPDLRQATKALEESLLAAAGAGPPAVGEAGDPGEEVPSDLHRERVQAQLERQTAENQLLQRQAAIHTAALTVMRTLSEVLAQPLEVPRMMGEVLVQSLDASGLSTGLLYLLEPGGRLHLQAHSGVPVTAIAEAEQGFGQADLLRRIVHAGQPVALSLRAPAADREMSELLGRVGRTSVLVVPFVVLGRAAGALVLASDSQELSESAWVGFSRSLAVQFGQAVGLGQSLSRLAASEERYRAVMEQANDAILLLDLPHRVLEANRQAERLLGRPREQIVGRHYDDFVVPEELEESARRQENLLRDGTLRVETRHFLRADGRRVPVEVSGSLVRMGDEHRVVAILRDVSERRQAAEQYRLLFDDSPQPMWVFDEETLRFLAVNHAATRKYGYAREEMLAMTVRDIRPPGERAAFDEDVAGRRRAGVRQAHESPRVWKHQKKNGESIDVEIAVSPIEFRGRAAWLVLSSDVTAKKRLEAQFLQAQKMESVGRLAGGVAHDFNNLLTVILGYAQLLAVKLPQRSDLLAHAREICKAGERASALTRQLLAFSRHQVLQPRVIELNAVVKDVETMLRRLIGENIELVTLLRAKGGRVLVDPGQVEQVIANLVVNARDAMPDGGRLILETADVELTAADVQREPEARPGPHVVIAVTDSGVGMDAETRAHLFEPFFTTKEQGKGTGLGLSTVYGIVRQSGGHIEVESKAGGGSTFRIYFPRAVPGEVSTARVDAAAQGKADRGSETVLLLEDEAALRALIRMVLEGGGYTVLDAPGTREALMLAEGHGGPIHLVISDVVMPGMSGPEVAARLASRRPEARVLFMSGYSGAAISHRGVLAPGARLLEKPFTAEGLLRTVREVLSAPDVNRLRAQETA